MNFVWWSSDPKKKKERFAVESPEYLMLKLNQDFRAISKMSEAFDFNPFIKWGRILKGILR